MDQSQMSPELKKKLEKMADFDLISAALKNPIQLKEGVKQGGAARKTRRAQKTRRRRAQKTRR
jgi:hypothetical protein